MQGVRVLERAVRPHQSVAEDDAPIVRDGRLRRAGESDLSLLRSRRRVHDSRHDSGRDQVTVGLVGGDITDAHESGSCMVVGRGDHDGRTAKRRRLVDGRADLGDVCAAHAERVQGDEHDARSRSLQDADPRVQRVEDARGRDVPQPADLGDADRRRDLG